MELLYLFSHRSFFPFANFQIPHWFSHRSFFFFAKNFLAQMLLFLLQRNCSSFAKFLLDFLLAEVFLLVLYLLRIHKWKLFDKMTFCLFEYNDPQFLEGRQPKQSNFSHENNSGSQLQFNSFFSRFRR